MAKASCDSCVYNVYDEDDETYYCDITENVRIISWTMNMRW